MNPGLHERTFFVTWANSGIGRSLVEALAARGAQLVLATRSEERTRPVLSALQSRYPAARAQWVSLDVSDLDSVRRAAQAYLASGHQGEPAVDVEGVGEEYEEDGSNGHQSHAQEDVMTALSAPIDEGLAPGARHSPDSRGSLSGERPRRHTHESSADAGETIGR